MDKANILAIGAHPDDIEFGCGGALIKYTRKGHRLFLLVMTGGGMGGSSSTRMKEQEDSRDILGAEKIYWGGYEDTHLITDIELIGKIEAVIGEVKPDFIFCNYPDDTHQDHRHLSQAIMSATRYIRNVLFFEGPTTQNFNPQVFVDISRGFIHCGSGTLQRQFPRYPGAGEVRRGVSGAQAVHQYLERARRLESYKAGRH
jgi:LmbE family N-acetylglucosaminyl deacetylase